MGLQTLIQRIAGRQIERQEVGRQSYRDILQRIAAGEEPSVDDVEHALNAAGKSVDELKADVQRLEEEARWRKEAGRLESLLAEKRSLEEGRRQIDEESDRVIKEIRAKRQTLETKAEALELALAAANTARHNLLE